MYSPEVTVDIDNASSLSSYNSNTVNVYNVVLAVYLAINLFAH